jgi:hypothetical protein
MSDLEEPESDDLIEEGLATFCTCSCDCPAQAHGSSGCRKCSCPAPGLRGLLLDDEDDDDDATLSVRLASGVAARRLRSRDPAVLKARELNRAPMMGGRIRRPRKAAVKATARSPREAAKLEPVGAQ